MFTHCCDALQTESRSAPVPRLRDGFVQPQPDHSQDGGSHAWSPSVICTGCLSDLAVYENENGGGGGEFFGGSMGVPIVGEYYFGVY